MASAPTTQNSLLGLLDAPRNATEAHQGNRMPSWSDPRCLRSSKEFLRLCENRSTLRDISNADCRSSGGRVRGRPRTETAALTRSMTTGPPAALVDSTLRGPENLRSRNILTVSCGGHLQSHRKNSRWSGSALPSRRRGRMATVRIGQSVQQIGRYRSGLTTKQMTRLQGRFLVALNGEASAATRRSARGRGRRHAVASDGAPASVGSRKQRCDWSLSGLRAGLPPKAGQQVSQAEELIQSCAGFSSPSGT